MEAKRGEYLHCIRVDRPREWPEAHLYAVADLHDGDELSDYRECAKIVAQIKDDPLAVCILNGDLMNTAIIGGKSDVYGELRTPEQEIDDTVGLFLPIRDKIIGITAGNHELRIRAQSGIDTMRHVAQRLGLLDFYCPDGVLVFLRFGQNGVPSARKRPQWYSIYATHGRGGGKKIGGKANRVEDMSAIIDADVYVHSHTHAPMVFPISHLRVSASNSTAEMVDSLCLNTGATLNYGGYAQQGEYRPASRQHPVGVLMAAEKKAYGVTDFGLLKKGLV